MMVHDKFRKYLSNSVRYSSLWLYLKSAELEPSALEILIVVIFLNGLNLDKQQFGSSSSVLMTHVD
jgi:hypothetical protein